MAHRPRNRFALLEILTTAKTQLTAAGFASAVRTAIQENWGEFGLAIAGAGFRVIAIESLGLDASKSLLHRHIAVIRFLRDSQQEVLSSLCLLNSSQADHPTSVCVLEICGRLRSTGEAGILFLQKVQLEEKERAKVISVLEALPEFA